MPLLNDVRLDAIGISPIRLQLRRFSGGLYLVDEYTSLFKDLPEAVEAELWVRRPLVFHQVPADGLM